jgi:hypoxanthine phosphoribosyltransferase
MGSNYMARNVLKVRRNSTKNNKLDLEHKTAEDIIFAHESEKEFARILDFYRIKWEYEPKTFTLEWDENDIPKKSFTPDFYLPDLDLYIELTTLNQRLVTKKNGKIKKLREMYPEINVKLFYKKDYNSLLFKYLNK